MKIGYLVPEFPGQTHVWMWREISHLRQWGVDTRLFSTRPPQERDRARHAFAAGAAKETIYLWPRGMVSLLSAVLWALWTRPLGVLRCLGLAIRLPVEGKPGRRVLPLVPMVCIMAREACLAGITHLHCHTCGNGAVLAMMLNRLTGIPYSMTLNANIEWWGGAMREKFLEAEFTIAITQWLLAQIRRDYPELGPDQSLLGRIGVDTRKWLPSSVGKMDATVFQIVTVGRLHASKGHDVLLRSVARVAKEGRRVSLIVIGDGPERGALESLAAELGLGSAVRFTGSLSEDQVIEHMKEADLFVLASHAEPLGVVYMEAMAMAVATIGTAAGGVGEIIRSGEDGLLVRPGDVDALVQAIEQMISDAPLRRRLAAAGRRSIVERFDSRLGAATLYQRLTGCPPRGAGLSEHEGYDSCAIAVGSAR